MGRAFARFRAFWCEMAFWPLLSVLQILGQMGGFGYFSIFGPLGVVGADPHFRVFSCEMQDLGVGWVVASPDEVDFGCMKAQNRVFWGFGGFGWIANFQISTNFGRFAKLQITTNLVIIVLGRAKLPIVLFGLRPQMWPP